MNAHKKPVVAIVGPTCTGKTALSLELAERLNGEIVACDSRTIYRYMDIGTAKPSKDEQRLAVHHMLDVANPDQVFTVAQFKLQAAKAVDEIHAKGRTPIVCGGTGFYARALLEGLSMPEVAPNNALREELKAFAMNEGNQSLHDRLQQIDPIAAAKIGVNDQFRIIRALEVFEATGSPFSLVATKEDPPYETTWFGLTFNNRALLRDLITQRVKAQIDCGLLDEIRYLLERFGETQAILNAVAYKEYLPFLKNEGSLEVGMDTCVQNNYQLARRQLMWFRANKSIQWFNVDEVDKAALPDLVEQSRLH